MTFSSNRAESGEVNGNRFARMRLGDSNNRSINMKRAGVLWKRSVGENEITLVDERGARTYSAGASVLLNLKSYKICDGTFVEVKVRKNVIETLNPVEFEGRVKKFAKKYAFLSTPILPQVKLKGDCKRAVAECRIVKDPPKALASVWFNPTSLHFPVVNEQLVFFSVCVTLRKIKRTRNPPYLDVHAIKIRPKFEGGREHRIDCGIARSPVALQDLYESKNSAVAPSPPKVPANPEASLRDWMVDRMGVNITKKLGSPQYESKPAPKVPKTIRRSRSASDIPRSSAPPQRLWNTNLLVTPALQKHRQRQAEEKLHQNAKQYPCFSQSLMQSPISGPTHRYLSPTNKNKSIQNRRFAQPVNRRNVLPSVPQPVNRRNILPSVPPCKASTPSIWIPPSRQPSLLRERPFAQEQKQQLTQIKAHVPRSPMAPSYFPRRGLKLSLSTNDLPARSEYSSIYHSTPDIWDTRSGGTSEAALTSLAGQTSPTISWMDGGIPLYGPATIANHKTKSLLSHWSSMPDLTRTQEECAPESLYSHENSEERFGIYRASSAPRLAALEENYRAKFQARDLDNENGLFEDLGSRNRVG